MRKIFLFMMRSLDGYFEAPGHDLSWHNVDEEFNQFANQQLDEIDTVLYGRRTYELMESFWPSETGLKEDPETAKRMNSLKKIVFSKSLNEVKETELWKNVTLKHAVDNEFIQELKSQPGKDIVVLGSSTLCVTLLKMGLLDEVRLMINPVILGQGTTVFHGLTQKLEMKLSNTREFSSGNVLNIYDIGNKSY